MNLIITTEDGAEVKATPEQAPDLFAAWDQWTAAERGSAAESHGWTAVLAKATEYLDEPRSVTAATVTVEPTVVGSIDLTPRGCTTPEGNARVNTAMAAVERTRIEVSTLALLFVEQFSDTVLCFDDDVKESWSDLRAAAKQLKAAQEEFLRAVAGAPPA